METACRGDATRNRHWSMVFRPVSIKQFGLLRLQDVVNVYDHSARSTNEKLGNKLVEAWEAKSPNTACVFLSPLSIGVPVKPMNDVLDIHGFG